MSRFVIDDPPGIATRPIRRAFAARLRRGKCDRPARCADCRQRRRSSGLRWLHLRAARESIGPLGSSAARSTISKACAAMRLACCASTPRRELRGNARLQCRESCERVISRLSGEKLRQLLKQRVNGFAERARKQAAFVAFVKAACADERLVGLSQANSAYATRNPAAGVETVWPERVAQCQRLSVASAARDSIVDGSAVRSHPLIESLSNLRFQCRPCCSEQAVLWLRESQRAIFSS